MRRLFILLLCLCLTACGQTPPSPAPPEEPAAPETAIPEEDGRPYGILREFDQSALPPAYAGAIARWCREGTLPDGSAMDWEINGIPQGGVAYAVEDVDGDGREELILQYTGTSMAGMTEWVYDYSGEDGTFRQQFSDFPNLTYYDNGAIGAGWSHNQGLSGNTDFWPYTLYRYLPESDGYEEVGAVDGWSRERTLLEDGSNTFPEETDADGDGFVYFLLPPGAWSYDTVVDNAAYEAWLAGYMDGAEELEISYVELELETVCPGAKG